MLFSIFRSLPKEAVPFPRLRSAVTCRFARCASLGNQAGGRRIFRKKAGFNLSSAALGWTFGLLGMGILEAYPPAPAFTIRGVARDQYGWAFRSEDQAKIVVRQGGAVVAEAPIDERQKVGENFRVLIPMDLQPGAPYTDVAQLPGSLLTFEVRLPTATLLVTKIANSDITVGEPAGVLVVDFSVGEDTDGDGIPDAWELWQLSEMGVDASLFNLDTLGNGDFDNDGMSDYDEYLAGTFAFLANDSLTLKIERLRDQWVDLKTFVVAGKAYQIEASEDLSVWKPVEVLPQGMSTPGLFWNAADTREIRVSVPKTTGEKLRFYRMSVRR